MIELVVDNEQTKAAREQALTWPEKARALRILDALGYERAAAMLLEIKALRGQVNEAFDPIITDANRVHKTACGKKREAEQPLVDAELVLKSAMGDWHREQERHRVAEQRRLEEEARQREEARRLEEAAALEREAHQTGDVGLQEEAEALISQPVQTMPVSVARTTPKVAGIVHRENWSARVTSMRALIKFVAEHPEYDTVLTVNPAVLNGLARSLKGNLKIDGVQAVNTPTVAAGAR